MCPAQRAAVALAVEPARPAAQLLGAERRDRLALVAGLEVVVVLDLHAGALLVHRGLQQQLGRRRAPVVVVDGDLGRQPLLAATERRHLAGFAAVVALALGLGAVGDVRLELAGAVGRRRVAEHDLLGALLAVAVGVDEVEPDALVLEPARDEVPVGLLVLHHVLALRIDRPLGRRPGLALARQLPLEVDLRRQPVALEHRADHLVDGLVHEDAAAERARQLPQLGHERGAVLRPALALLALFQLGEDPGDLARRGAELAVAEGDRNFEAQPRRRVEHRFEVEVGARADQFDRELEQARHAFDAAQLGHQQQVGFDRVAAERDHLALEVHVGSRAAVDGEDGERRRLRRVGCESAMRPLSDPGASGRRRR